MPKPLPRARKHQATVIVRRPLKIALFGPPKSRVLQLAGPWEVFSRANDLLAEKHPNDKPGYQFELITMDRSGFIECFDGLRIQAKHFHSLNPNVDTLLVGGSMDKDDRLPGPRAVWELPKDEEFFDWLRVASAKARRVVAIGSGAFFLAGAGLLGGRRVTTHWRWVERLQRSYPSILVDPNRYLYGTENSSLRPAFRSRLTLAWPWSKKTTDTMLRPRLPAVW